MELPKGDWVFSMLHQYLFDAAEMVRLKRLVQSQYPPLAHAAAKIRTEEIYHYYRHTSTWSTDWITDEAREKLKAFGLAPPPKQRGNLEILLSDTATCPYCDSPNTILKNTFGPTLCRAIYYCNGCQQPFEQFKPL